MKRLLLCLLMSARTLMALAQPCQSGHLDPRVALSLKTVLMDLPTSSSTSVEQVRNAKLPIATFPVADVQSLKVTADSIPLQLYNPAHQTDLPIIISFHPGGFVTPFLPFMQYDCWRQARAYHALVIAVDYRIAPQHPYPAAVDDAYAAFKWVLRNGQYYGGDTSRIMVLGLSAGANLAAVVCQKAKKEGLSKRIKLQVLNCPSTDHPRNFARHASYQHNASGYFLTKVFCLYSIQTYAPAVALDNPEVAPLQSETVSGLPPTVIITAEFDPLRDEGYAYAERLRKAGVPVRYTCFSGQIHCLLGLPPEADELTELDSFVVGAINTFLPAK